MNSSTVITTILRRRSRRSVKRTKHPRHRKSPEEQAWSRIHGELAEILSEIKYLKSNKEYVRLTYNGSMKTLRKHCLKMLNLIDSKDEFRWD